MTKKDEIIYNYLLIHPGDFLTPTEIGTGCGKVYNAASGWANASLKRLVKSGKVICGAKGFYSAVIKKPD